MVVAQTALISFANGYWARLIQFLPEYKDKNGRRRQKINMALSIAIKDDYKIKEGTYIGDYPSELIEPISLEHTHASIWIHCGFKEEITLHTLRNAELLRAIEMYEKNDQISKLHIAKLMQDNAILVGNKEKELKQLGIFTNLLKSREEHKDEGENMPDRNQ